MSQYDKKQNISVLKLVFFIYLQPAKAAKDKMKSVDAFKALNSLYEVTFNETGLGNRYINNSYQNALIKAGFLMVANNDKQVMLGENGLRAVVEHAFSGIPHLPALGYYLSETTKNTLLPKL